MNIHALFGGRAQHYTLIIVAALLFAATAVAVSAHGNDWVGYSTPYTGYTYTPYTHYYQNSYSYGINGWGAYSVHYNNQYRYNYRYPYYAYRNPYYLQPAVIYSPYPYTYGTGAFR